MRRVIVSLVMSAALSVGTVAAAQEAPPHFFEEPYLCDFEKEVTSRSTGKTRLASFRFVYFPEENWRLMLLSFGGENFRPGKIGTANLFTPDTRYDGAYRHGQTDGEVASVEMMTAWPQENPPANYSGRREDDNDISLCRLLNDAEQEVFVFPNLDTAEVME